jgi:HK97 gp10 family phage protein
MPYEMKVDGMAEISTLLDKMDKEAPKVAARALYEGAGIMADEIKKGAGLIKTAPFKYAGNGESRLPSPEEKEIVMNASAGIAKFDKNGTEVDTSVGYRNAGYAELNGKTKPIPVIVNSINSGTSFMKKQPFVRKAARSGGQKAINAMARSIEDAFEAINNK